MILCSLRGLRCEAWEIGDACRVGECGKRLEEKDSWSFRDIQMYVEQASHAIANKYFEDHRQNKS